MLHDNIKGFRKNRGLTQEELAIRLNVVRQTVSKWETGQSVPDADLLQKLAEILEVPVSELLGGTADRDTDQTDEIAVQLARINEQLSIQNCRRKRLWRFVGILLGSMVGLWLIGLILMMIFSFAGPVVTHEVIVHETACEQTVVPIE